MIEKPLPDEDLMKKILVTCNEVGRERGISKYEMTEWKVNEDIAFMKIWTLVAQIKELNGLILIFWNRIQKKLTC